MKKLVIEKTDSTPLIILIRLKEIIRFQVSQGLQM